MKEFTKESLIAELKAIHARGWIECCRQSNSGGIGNTLEDLLGITENNLPIPNAAEWELKTQRTNTTSLTTLIHVEPSPTVFRFVPKIFLPKYGWTHQEAGNRYRADEMSFRQTIHGRSYSDRGFTVQINRQERKIQVSFDATKVSERHALWLETVKNRVGNLDELNPQPYWGFDDLAHRVGAKLHNCFYVQADTKTINGSRHYHYKKVMMLERLDFEGFLKELEAGNILVEFDARTGHNHGSKFRMRQNILPNLYDKATVII